MNPKHIFTASVTVAAMLCCTGPIAAASVGNGGAGGNATSTNGFAYGGNGGNGGDSPTVGGDGGPGGDADSPNGNATGGTGWP